MARVLPSLIWKTLWLYCRHHFSQTEAWSGPRARRWPVMGREEGISKMPFMWGMSVAVEYCWSLLVNEEAEGGEYVHAIFHTGGLGL